MTGTLDPEAASDSDANRGDWPRIPDVAWRRGIGVPCQGVGHPACTRR